MELRKFSIFVEDILTEGGRKLVSPTRRVAACGVIRNPFAGKPPIDDFSELVDISVDAGELLTQRALEAPGRIIREFNIPFSRPRSIGLFTDSSFLEYIEKVNAALYEGQISK